jgi:flagellar FliL protein
MAKTKPVPTTDDESAPSGGGRKKKLLIAGPLVVALVAGWFFLLGPGGGSAEPEVEAAPEPGEVLALEPITMNLSDGRLLKLGLALQLPLEPSGHEVSGSVALDEAISFLGEHSYDQLSAPTARDTAKLELSKRVAERYHHDVLEVYFTEFVMQ